MTERQFPLTIPIQPADTPESDCCMGSHVLSTQEAQHFSTQLKALADPTRLMLISHIADRRCEALTVNQLTALSGLSQSTVSHHLKKLADAGLIRKQRQGLEVLHFVEEDQFATLSTLLSLR